jgi:hypothetical protein
MAADSDDDRPIGEMTESDVEMMRYPVALILEFMSSVILLFRIKRVQKDVMMSCRKLQRLVWK